MATTTSRYSTYQNLSHHRPSHTTDGFAHTYTFNGLYRPWQANDDGSDNGGQKGAGVSGAKSRQKGGAGGDGSGADGDGSFEDDGGDGGGGGDGGSDGGGARRHLTISNHNTITITTDTKTANNTMSLWTEVKANVCGVRRGGIQQTIFICKVCGVWCAVWGVVCGVVWCMWCGVVWRGVVCVVCGHLHL